MSQLWPLPYLFVVAALAAGSSEAFAARHHEIQHKKKPEAASAERQPPKDAKDTSKDTSKDPSKDPYKDPSKAASKPASKSDGKTRHAEHAAKRRKRAHGDDGAPAKPEPELTGDLAAVRDAIDEARHGKTNDATEVEKKISDPAAQKLAEWFILRHPDSVAPFSRYAAFTTANPEWPGAALMRRRAEARLWQEKSEAATVHSFTGDHPVTLKGRLALARTLLGEGDRDGATRLVRDAFRSEDLSERLETEVTETFGDLLTREDYQARMDKRIGAKDMSAAMRAAHHLGDDAVSIVKACSAVKGNDDKAPDQLDSVSADARQDLGYVLCRIQWLMRKDKTADAIRLVLAAPNEAMALQDTDEWWRARRSLARKLLDQGDFQNAYELVRSAAVPASENYRAESHFLPGWIALRYLGDAKTAMAHFAHIDDGNVDPITLARANYWRGRAAEALGDKEAMRAYYEAAGSHPTAYYGQLALARLGPNNLTLHLPPRPDPTGDSKLADELARAADMLYTLGERETVVSFVSDLAAESTDVAALSAVAEVTGRHDDARAMLELGRTALGRGLAVDTFAFPTIGIPQHDPIGPAIDRSIIYSVARTESAFNQRDRSSASAVGLMQVTPEAGRDTAKRFGVEYDWDRLVSDPVYNTQMGAAELSALLQEYKGSYIMTFAGYNAGRGRVRDWIKAYGDPRDPNVDAVDWVERIPFAETRNYVQRVMENLLVYWQRFEEAAPNIAADAHPAAAQEVTSAVPAP